MTAKDDFIDLGPAFEILETIRQDEIKSNLRIMEETRDKIEAIRANPKPTADSFDQSTTTGSFLAALGIKKTKSIMNSQIAQNMAEINEKEEKIFAARRAMATGSGAVPAAKSEPVTEPVAAAHKKRARTRR
jgi:hypothetical protein